MPSTGTDTSERFTMLCLKCGRVLAARREWIGRDVRCPQCAELMRVPTPRADGQPAKAVLPPIGGSALRFQFGCPRCETLLESEGAQSGRVGTCPTCAAQFTVPRFTAGMHGLPIAKLLVSDDQDPTPLHAYAASGRDAPRIHRRGDGLLEIECPRCRTHCDISANVCVECGTPFTIEGVPTVASVRADPLGTAALIVGIISIPLCMLFVPVGLAAVLGLIGLLRAHHARPGRALAGFIMGVISLALGLMILYL